eukprot:gene19053-20966_t
MYGGGQRSLNQSMKQRSLSTGDLKSSQRTGEQQTKIVNQSIEKIETHYPQLVHDLNNYIVRTAKLRDSGDNMHRSFIRYAQDESPALKGGLEGFGECFAAIQDLRNTMVLRLEDKVLKKFAVYETRCKQARDDLRVHAAAHMKELQEHKTLERIKIKSPNQNFKLAQAETKFQKAADEASRSIQILKDQVTKFHRQKAGDLKQIFGDFMLSEMMFYAKALEIYTTGYQELMKVDVEQEVESIEKSLSWNPHSFSQSDFITAYGGSAPNLLGEPSSSVRQPRTLPGYNSDTL